MEVTATYPIYSFNFWKAYAVHMRPYLLFISGIAGATGIALGSESTPVRKIIISFIVFFFGYGFGQALTDCFQTDTDKISAPYRPLSKGIISVSSVLIVSSCGLFASGIILYFLHWFNIVLSLVSIFGLATYSYVKKNWWFAGPFYNASIVCMLPIMGFISTNMHDVKLTDNLYLSLAITFFSYSLFVLIGYLKDIDADKATGYKTFPVVFGWKNTVRAGDVFALVTLCLFWMRGTENLYEIIFGIAGSLILVYGQVLGHLSKRENEKDALVPILCTVRSFILLHISMMLHIRPTWLLFSILFYVLFEISLYLRPSRYQV